jgi:hypothetical protein
VSALATAFAATQDPPLVNGVTSRIQDNAIPFTPQPLSAVTVTAPGSGYSSAPTVQFMGGLPGSGATATATVIGGKVTAINLVNPGSGYSYPPTVLLSGGGGFGATAVASVANTQQMLPKAIQELFDPLGRMNATLGVELPFTSALTQTTIPLGFVDPATEVMAPGEVQIWKITHNGVDSHGVHFHLVNVQVVNRVGWDGAIRDPDPNELGWKETVRMNPLEDIIVVAKAKPPLLPFGQPNSIRPLDVTQPLGSTANFTNVDPLTGRPPAVPVSNVMTNFGWEYTWHCHLLGHEENDMMRALIFTVPSSLPPAFVQNAAIGGIAVNLSWTDPTPFNYSTGLPLSTINNPANEIGFNILRAPGSSGGSFARIAAVPANSTSFIDTAPLAGTNRYQIVAFNAAGSTASNTVSVSSTPPPVITTTALPGGIVGVAYNQSISVSGGLLPLSWSISGGALPTPLTLNPATGVISGIPNAARTFSFTVLVSDAAARSTSATLSITITTPVSITTTNLPNGGVGVAYSQTLAASGGTTPYSWSLVGGGALPTSLTLNGTTGVISGTPSVSGTFTFTVRVSAANGTTATRALSIIVVPAVSITTTALPGGTVGVAYSQTLNATGATTPYAWSLATGSLPTSLTLNPTSGVISGIPTSAGTFNFTVRVTAANGSTATRSLSIAVAPRGPAAPSNLTATINSTTQIALSWTDASNNETSFAIWRSVNGGAFSQIGSVNRSPGQSAATGGTVSFNNNGVTVGNSYTYYVTAVNANGASAASNSVTVNFRAPAAPSALRGSAARIPGNPTQDRVTLNWTDNASNETGFTIQRAGNPNFNGATIFSVGANVTSFTQNVSRTSNYYYRVQANNSLGNSAWTNGVLVTTP